MKADLEYLRMVFADVRQHVGIGVITQIGLSRDFTILRAQVSLLPEKREVVTSVSFSDPYEVTFPQVGDLVVVGFGDGDPNEAHIVARFPSAAIPIPAFARSGDSVKYARPGKKMYVGSDTKIGLARPNKEPAQPMVLGTVLVNGLTALVNAFLNAAQVGQSAMGPVVLDPSVRTALSNFVSTYLTTASTNVVSQISYTERGTE